VVSVYIVHGVVQSFYLDHILVYLMEGMISGLNIEYWSHQVFKSSDLLLDFIEIVLIVNPLPDWVVHFLQGVHLFSQLVEMVLSLDLVDWIVQLFQITHGFVDL